MKIPVYIDVLFVLNLFINYLLLVLTARVSHNKIGRVRIIIASALGSLYACLIFFVKLPTMIVFITKFIVGLIVVKISFLDKKLSNVFHLGLIFLIINILLGGFCYIIRFVFSPPNMILNNNVIYINLSPAMLIIITIVTYAALTFLETFLKSRFLNKKIYRVEIFHNQTSCILNGFIDTGNNLVDYFTNSPIIVCNLFSIKELLNDKEFRYYKDFSLKDNNLTFIPKTRLVPVNTVSSSGFLPAFAPEKVILTSEHESYDIKNVLIAVSNQSTFKNNDVILNPKLIKE